MKRASWLALVVLCVGAASCRDLSVPDPGPRAFVVGNSPPQPSAEQVPPDPSLTPSERKLVMTARLTVEVKSVADAAREIQKRAVEAAGFVGNAETSRDRDGRANASLTFRVPSAKLDATLDFVRTLGRVSAEQLASEDVTKTYFDLQTRLRVKRQTEERLRALLQTHSGKLSEIVEVERELDRVVGEIEQLEGARAYYDHQVAMAAVTVFLAEPGASKGWTGLRPIREAFGNSFRALAASFATLIYVVCFVVPWLLVATIAWFAWRWAARKWLLWTKAE